MDIASLFGIVAGIGVIIHALMSGSAPLTAFYDLPSIEIVIGGTLAATMLSFPMRDVLQVVNVTFIIFKKGVDSNAPMVEAVVDLSRSARLGVTELEKTKDSIDVPFLRDGVQMIIDGYSELEIRDILDTRIDNREIREKWEENVLRTMGKYSPAFGMIGTLIGLIGMLLAMGESDDAVKSISKNMSIALITTFYGVIFANLFINPMAEKFKSRIEQQTVSQLLLVEGIALLYQKKHPLVVREKLNAFIPPKEWKREDEGGKE